MPDAWQSNLCISLGPARGVARVGRPLQTGSILIYWLGNCLGRSFTAIASRSPEFNTHTRRASVTPVSARGNWAISFLCSFFYRFIYLNLLFPRLPDSSPILSTLEWIRYPDGEGKKKNLGPRVQDYHYQPTYTHSLSSLPSSQTETSSRLVPGSRRHSCAENVGGTLDWIFTIVYITQQPK